MIHSNTIHIDYLHSPLQWSLYLQHLQLTNMTEFGAVGSYTDDMTYITVAIDELPGRMWYTRSSRATSDTLNQKYRPIAVFPCNGNKDEYRLIFPYNYTCSYGQSHQYVQSLQTLTIHITDSNAVEDTRTMYYWIGFRFLTIAPKRM